MKQVLGLCIIVFLCSTWTELVFCAPSLSSKGIQIPEGQFVPFFKEASDKAILVKSFLLDSYPVTNAEFNEFLIQNPQFQKNKIISLFADQRYLQDWKTPLLSAKDLEKMGQQPVTYTSWFVAKKFCQAQNKRLPTIAEWEYASDFTNPEVLNDLLAWYAKTGDVPNEPIGQHKPNKFGLYDMHGLIWEWVDDFSSVMISSDSRSKGDRTDGFFCGGGSVSSLDSKSYATFMRYGFRSGLRGDYCMKNLGFRCAQDIKGEVSK